MRGFTRVGETRNIQDGFHQVQGPPLAVKGRAMPITTEDINERIREQGNQYPTSPVRKDFQTDQDFQEAMWGWGHRVARALLPTMSLWLDSRAKSKSAKEG